MADILGNPNNWTANQPIPDAKWDQFCSLVAEGLTVSAAKRRVGYVPSTNYPERFAHMVPKRIEFLRGLLEPETAQANVLPPTDGNPWSDQQLLSIVQQVAVDPKTSPGDRLKAALAVREIQAKLKGSAGLTPMLFKDMKRITAQQAGLPYSGPKEVENLGEPGDALADLERDGMQGLADALKGEGTNG